MSNNDMRVAYSSPEPVVLRTLRTSAAAVQKQQAGASPGWDRHSSLPVSTPLLEPLRHRLPPTVIHIVEEPPPENPPAEAISLNAKANNPATTPATSKQDGEICCCVLIDRIVCKARSCGILTSTLLLLLCGQWDCNSAYRKRWVDPPWKRVASDVWYLPLMSRTADQQTSLE
jgi:hypothetical protein